MSCSNSPVSLIKQEDESDGEEQKLEGLEAIKRKFKEDENFTDSVKKIKTENYGVEGLEEAPELDIPLKIKSEAEDTANDQKIKDNKLVKEEQIKEGTAKTDPLEIQVKQEDDDSSESGKSPNEPDKKEDPAKKDEPSDDPAKKDKPPEDPVKKDKNMDKKERKVQNLRKNIKDVIDDTQLDEQTLEAQRQESERLARLQEQQRLLRETQRQMAANKTQQKVLSLLQGESSEPSSSVIDFDDPILEKFALSSEVNITPAAKATLESLQSLISTDDQSPDREDEGQSDDDDVVFQPDESQDKSKAVVVDSSSDSDDCIILSDEEAIEDDDENNSGEHTNDIYNQKDSEGRVLVNVGHSEKEPNIYVAPQIARVIKPHQIGGVRFLYDNIIESTELFDKSTGFGCILAHSMGLGKTLQLVCFCDIFLRHTNSKSILIIMPINTLQNWLHEFNLWTPLPEDVDKSPLKKDGEVRPRQHKVFVLNDAQKSLHARSKVVLDWKKEGGVLMMGYELYRLLSLKKKNNNKVKKETLENDFSVNENQEIFDSIFEALVNPGPDLIICDEGHRIKNAHASTSIALKEIKSKRRIVLTGYPLQNNLVEYWCMVDFVRPNYLGNKTEFCNMFERPIMNGQCLDSTVEDWKLMRYRAHVLHSLLKGFVQRRSHTVLQKCLPNKTEFVLLVRMTEFQRKLYNVFMDEVVRSKKVPNPLKAFSVCCKIWNHPDVLYNFLKKRELDLDIEEEADSVKKTDLPETSGSKKKGRKIKKNRKGDQKGKGSENDKEKESLEPIKLEPTSVDVKPALSIDSASSQSLSSNSSSGYSSGFFDSNSYHSYNSTSNYNYNSNGYSGSYWQNNYHQSDFSQNYYQQNPSSFYYGNSNFNADKKLQIKSEPEDVKPKLEDGGLLADVIKEERRDKQEKDDIDVKDIQLLTKNPRDDGIPYDWATDLMKDYIPDLLENAPKMEIFFCILDESIRLGDRILVFSQSLLTLNILERFLQKSKIPNSESCWAKNSSYFRLDGSTTALEREKLINEFNASTKVKLFLVSTRAGSLGINLVGANRVVVFDASWNPCHDTQAVCRVYRYGQSKTCFVYRFVMDNCLEKKIYDRQINKQGMADRVVDECNPDAHLSIREVSSLCYNDGVDPEVQDFSSKIHQFADLIMKKVLQTHSSSLTKEPFQHESLLVDRKEMKLSLAEKRLAQRSYEMEKQMATKPSAPYNYNPVGSNYRAYRTPDGTIIHRPVNSGRPIQDDFNVPMNPLRDNNPRPNRWTPVEVWQSKGLTAQEMTLPQDISIQTNSADKSKIFLKAGQKVIVLKSPKGICLQLESGKVIAIRASVKGGQPAPGPDQRPKDLPPMQNMPQSRNFPPNYPAQNAGDVIHVIDDDEDDDKNKTLTMEPSPAGSNGPSKVQLPEVPQYREKAVYKPNLVQRRSKMPPPPVPSQDSAQLPPYAGFHSSQRSDSRKWNGPKDPNAPSTSSYSRTNGNSQNHFNSYIPKSESSRSMDSQQPDSSAFLSGNDTFSAQLYPSQNLYQNPPYPNSNYSSNYNFPYQSSYSNASPNYQFPSPSSSGSYDTNYYQSQSYNQPMNYNQNSSPHINTYPPAVTDPSGNSLYTSPTSFDQYKYN